MSDECPCAMFPEIHRPTTSAPPLTRIDDLFLFCWETGKLPLRGRTDSRTVWRAVRRADGRADGRSDGRTDGRTDGRKGIS